MNDLEDLVDERLLAESRTLSRQYDDLRVRLIVLNATPEKDVQAIDEVVERLAQVRSAIDVGPD